MRRSSASQRGIALSICAVLSCIAGIMLLGGPGWQGISAATPTPTGRYSVPEGSHTCLEINKYGKTGLLDLSNGLYIEAPIQPHTLTYSADGRFTVLLNYESRQIEILDSQNQASTFVQAPAGAMLYSWASSWSPDNQTLVISTNLDNQRRALVTLHAPTGKLRVIEIAGQVVPGYDGYIEAWNRDGTWAAIRFSRDQSGQVWDYFFLNIAEGRVLSGPEFWFFSNSQRPEPAWSPDGRQFAYMREINGQRQLVIYDVTTRNAQFVHMQTRLGEIRSAVGLLWSPDSAIIGVHGGVQCEEIYDPDCTFGTLFFTRDGAPLSFSSGELFSDQLSPRWVGDASSLLILLRSPLSREPRIRALARYMPRTGQTEILMPNYDPGEYYGTPIDTDSITTDGTAMLIPVTQGNRTAVDLYQIQSGQRTTILDRIALLTPVRFTVMNYKRNPFAKDPWLFVAGQADTGHGMEGALVWVRSDGTQRGELRGLAEGVEEYLDVFPVPNHQSLAVVVGRAASRYDLLLLDLETGHTQAIHRETELPYSAVYGSPDGRWAVVKVGDFSTYLIQTDTRMISGLNISHQIGQPTWSPDGSQLVILTHDPDQPRDPVWLELVDFQAQKQSRYPVGDVPAARPKGATLVDSRVKWRRCAITPDDALRPTMTPTPTATATRRPLSTVPDVQTEFACLIDSVYQANVLTGEVKDRAPVSGSELPPPVARRFIPSSSRATYGDKVAYLEYVQINADSRAMLHIQSRDGQLRTVIDTPFAAGDLRVPYRWFGSLYPLISPDLVFSPDGRYVLAQVLIGHTESQDEGYQIVVADADDPKAVMPIFATRAGSSEDRIISRAIWSANGRAILFWRQRGADRVLVAFDLNTKREAAISSDGKRLSSSMPLTAAIPWPDYVEFGRTALVLRRAGVATPILAAAENMGDPYWSPDGNYVAVVWAMGQAQARKVFLTITSADGSQVRTLDDGFWDVRDLRWLTASGDDPQLAYVATRGDGYSVESVSAQSGARSVIRKGLTRVSALEGHPTQAGVVFWWEDGSRIGLGTYGLDGSTLAESIMPVKIDGLELFPTPYRWIWFREIERSPDGKVYAIRPAITPLQAYSEKRTLILMAWDGSWVKAVRSGLTALAQPYGWWPEGEHFHWSPDGKLLAFNQVDGPVGTLDVITADGQPVRFFYAEALRSAGRNAFEWARCH